MINVFDLRRKK